MDSCTILARGGRRAGSSGSRCVQPMLTGVLPTDACNNKGTLSRAASGLIRQLQASEGAKYADAMTIGSTRSHMGSTERQALLVGLLN